MAEKLMMLLHKIKTYSSISKVQIVNKYNNTQDQCIMNKSSTNKKIIMKFTIILKELINNYQEIICMKRHYHSQINKLI